MRCLICKSVSCIILSLKCLCETRPIFWMLMLFKRDGIQCVSRRTGRLKSIWFNIFLSSWLKKLLMNSSFSSHLTSVKLGSWTWSQTPAAQSQTIWTPAELSWWSMIWIRADRLLCADTGRMLYCSRFNTNNKHQQDVRAALWCFTVAGRMKAPQNVGNVKDKVALGQKPQHTDR